MSLETMRLDAVWARINHVVSAAEWEVIRPLLIEIEALKALRGIKILAHNYQPAPIFWGVADLCGDSLELAKLAAEHRFERVLMCGVSFMAETVKLLNPSSQVLIPSLRAGCSLAESITASDIRALRLAHPDAAVVVYVNTSAEVKAEADICCTSANALEVVESCPQDEVIFLPDQHLAAYVQRHTSKRLITWAGSCEVHDVFGPEDLKSLRLAHPEIVVLAHPECHEQVQLDADFVGSTSAMVRYVKEHRPTHAALITECTMSDNVAAECPETTFRQPCTLCPYMRRITLENIVEALTLEQHEVLIPEEVAAGARASLARMLALKPREVLA